MAAAVRFTYSAATEMLPAKNASVIPGNVVGAYPVC